MSATAQSEANNAGVVVISKPLLKLRLLEMLRDGSFDELTHFIATKFIPLDNPIIQELAPLVLHFAVQVASLKLVKDIVAHWVDNPVECKTALGTTIDINGRDEEGNTPLHLAALQSRINVIQFLLKHRGINELLVNDEGLLAIDLCKNLNVAEMMQTQRTNYISKVIKDTYEAFEKKDFKFLDQAYTKPRNQDFMNINQLDPLDHGNSLLHKYVLKNDVDTCKWLLSAGANPLLKNAQGLSALDIVKSKQKTTTTTKPNPELKKLFNDILKEEAVVNATLAIEKAPTYKGYLKKYARMGKGYKLRYFVLTEDGKLSYYKDPAAVAANKPPRGSLNLVSCYLHMDSTEKLKFEVIGGNNNSARWRLKGNQALETNNWVMTIQSAIRFAKDKRSAKKVKTTAPGHKNLKIDTNTSTIQTPTKVINNVKSPTIQKASTFDAQYARTQNVRRPPNRSPLHRQTTDTSSFNSTDVELSSNLTESGKNYVNKMIDSRLERTGSFSSHNSILDSSIRPMSPLGNPRFMTSTAGISYMSTENLNMSSRSLVGSPTTITSGTGFSSGYQEGVVEGGDGSDSELENDDDHSHTRDDEYLRVEYGPYVEKLNMYQKTIALELSSINEIIVADDFKNNEEALNTIKESLLRLSNNITEMNGITFRRDEKLVAMLTKQRDMNNVWIQTMKDLEIELEDKSERLATLGRGRRTLKRTLKKKMREANSQSNINSEVSLQSMTNDSSSDTLNQIAKFITATKEEDEVSDGDEFYDAEELMDELAMQQLDNTETLSYTKSNEVASENTHVENGTMPISPESIKENVSINSDDADEPIYIKASHHGLHSMKSHTTEESQPDEPVIKEQPQEEIKSNHTAEVEPIKKTTSRKSQKSQKSDLKVPQKLIAVTKIQKVKENMLWDEGTYLGYEDGPRKKLTLDQDDRPKVSLWAVLKSMIGKDMTRMTLPVVFNEPTSLLQRVAEDVECSYLLDEAATFKDSTLRLLYVSIFTASCYASTVGRIAKPFNPLLGETFEYARPDKNYRFFSEQVSHHPPISATWTESPKWDFYGESAVDTNFNGRSFGVKHLGMWNIQLRPDNDDPTELYTYKKPGNTVVGILVGNPQVDNHGEVHITNHTTGEYCLLNFKARGWRSSSAYEIKGEVFDKNKKRVWVLGGHWNESIYAKKVTGKNSDFPTGGEKSKKADPGPNYNGDKFLVWKANPRPNAPFHLTQFAISLNAPQPHLVNWIAPTDTRLRPDQRAMENGEYDKAADEKNRVEEKQRAAKRHREEKNIKYQPRWFKHDVHPVTKQPYWKFQGKYWAERRDKHLADTGDIF